MSEASIPILIVDDEVDLLEMYRDLFELEGFEVFTAVSGESASQILKEHQEIKVVISDSNMNGMSGLQLLAAIKSECTVVPNFYLATGGVDYTDDQIKSLGGRGLALKPFDLDEIIVRIKKDLMT